MYPKIHQMKRLTDKILNKSFKVFAHTATSNVTHPSLLQCLKACDKQRKMSVNQEVPFPLFWKTKHKNNFILGLADTKQLILDDSPW